MGCWRYVSAGTVRAKIEEIELEDVLSMNSGIVIECLNRFILCVSKPFAKDIVPIGYDMILIYWPTY